MRECEEDDAKGMVSDIEGVGSLGGGVMSRSIRDGICVCMVLVVLVVMVVLMVAMGVMGIVVRGGESGVYRSGGSGGSVVHGSVGGGLCRSGWCFDVQCGFHGEGGGGSGAGDGVCCEVFCEAGSVVCKRDGTFFALLYREIGGN